MLDCGEGVCTAVSIYKGYAIQNAMTRIDLGGRDVTQYLQLLLRKRGHVFHKSSEFEIVRQIKEGICYVPRNFAQEEEMEKQQQIFNKDYVLPDGSIIKVGGEQFRAPEILFKPDMVGLEYMGVHDVVTSSIFSCDYDVRPELASNIYLAGGSTVFDGFGDRLLSEARKRIPKSMKVRIIAPPERKYSAWIGMF